MPRFRVIVQLGHEDDPGTRFALLEWVITRLVEVLRESPAPVTIRIESEE